MPLWLGFHDRFAVVRVSLHDVANEHGLDVVERKGRGVWLTGRYFRVMRAKTELREELDHILSTSYRGGT